MKTTYRGVLTALLATLLTLFLSPAMAEGYGLFIAGTEVTSENCNNLKNISGVRVADDGELKYNPSSKTLTMKGVTLDESGANGNMALHNATLEDLKIVVEGENSFTTKAVNCFQFNAATSIMGDGKLTAISKSSEGAGILLFDKQLTIIDITLHVEGGTGIKASLREGTYIQGALSLQYATVYAKGRERSITEIKDLDLVQCKILEPSGASWHSVIRSVVNEKGKYVPEVKIAPSYYFSIAGVEINGNNVNQMNTLPGVEPGSELKYNPKTRTLTMKNVRMNLDNEEFRWKVALFNEGCDDLTIEVLGDNEITSRGMTLYLRASTKIKGGGSLTLKSINHTGVAIFLTTLSISDITLNVEGNKAIDGETNGNFTDLTLQNVTANIKGRRGAIVGLNSFKLEGGDMIAPVNGRLDKDKHAIMDGSEVANEVRIAGHWGLKPNILDEVPATGGTPSVTLTSNKSWTLALDPADATAWVTPSASNGTGNKTITFTVAKNKTPEARSVKAVFTQAETNRKISLEIKQAEGESIFLLQPKTLEEVAKAGGAPSVTLTSSKPWTLALEPADAGWVTPSATSGTGTQEVTFTVVKNETAAARSVKAIFTQADTKKTRELEIKQAAGDPIFLLQPETLAEVAKEGGAPSVTLTSNKPWALALDPADATAWVTPSATSGTGTQEVTFTVAKNETTAARSVKATFTQADTKKTLKLEVKQAAGEAIFTLNPETLAEVTKEGGKPSVTLTSSKPWTLALNPADAGWVTASPTGGTGNETITFTVVKNETTAARSVKAIFTQADTQKTLELEVKQAAGDPIFLLQPETLAEVAKEGGAPSVTLTSNKAWTLTLDPADATAWVTPSATSGTGTQEVTFTVAKNETTAARSVKAIFTQADTKKTLELEVKQAAGEAGGGGTPTPNPSTFKLMPETLAEIPAAGSSPTVTVNSDKAWTLTLNPADATAWVTPSATSGTGTQEVTFTVVKNEATTSRTVVVTFKQAETEKELQLTITQGAAESVQVPLIGISFTESNVSLKVGMSTTLVVKYNPENATNKEVTWEVTEGATSLSVDANGKITATNVAGTAKVKATSKDGGHTAECTVTVTAADVPVVSIAVSPVVVNLTVGGTQQLSVSVNPRTATNKTATWAVTAGVGIVSVNGTGLVKALKAGTAKVTATVGGKTATCTVNVKAKDAPTVPKAVEDAVLASVVVAPNPFSSQLRIVNPEGIALRYELVTLTGNVVRAGALDGTETVVDTEALPAGLYFVRITGQNGAKKAVKVIKY